MLECSGKMEVGIIIKEAITEQVIAPGMVRDSRDKR